VGVFLLPFLLSSSLLASALPVSWPCLASGSEMLRASRLGGSAQNSSARNDFLAVSALPVGRPVNLWAMSPEQPDHASNNFRALLLPWPRASENLRERGPVFRASGFSARNGWHERWGGVDVSVAHAVWMEDVFPQNVGLIHHLFHRPPVLGSEASRERNSTCLLSSCPPQRHLIEFPLLPVITVMFPAARADASCF